MRFSERDFASELGRNLLIYPFQSDHIDSSSCDLTASHYAWKLSDKQSAVENGEIKIPAKESVLVVTNETISLQKNLCGICCSSVSLATKGVIINTTPVKCGWIGKQIFTVCNPTNDAITIKVGGKIAVLLVEQLRSSTKKAPQNTNCKTTELLRRQGIQLTDEDTARINDVNYSDVQNLREALKKETTYREFRTKRKHKYVGYVLVVAVAIIAVILAAHFFEAKEFVPALVVAFVCTVGAVTWNMLKVSWE